MAKFHGVIGYGESVEKSPGVWVDMIVERECVGELNRNFKNSQSAENLVGDIDIANEVSILADPHVCNHASSMKYITFWGTKWKIKSVEIRYPRLILTVGGVYNGQQA